MSGTLILVHIRPHKKVIFILGLISTESVFLTVALAKNVARPITRM